MIFECKNGLNEHKYDWEKVDAPTVNDAAVEFASSRNDDDRLVLVRVPGKGEVHQVDVWLEWRAKRRET